MAGEMYVSRFHSIFKIPEDHPLDQCRSRSLGALGLHERWTHEEYDSAGLCVARFESWADVDASGARRFGWRKLSPCGRELETGEVAQEAARN